MRNSPQQIAGQCRKMNSQLFVSKYQLYLPSAEELRAEIERERDLVVREKMEQYGVET